MSKKSYKSAITLVEILLVIGLIGLVIGIGPLIDDNILKRSEVNVTYQKLLFALRKSQTNAQAGYHDTNWGTRILTDRIVVYTGQSYAGSDTQYEEIFIFPERVLIEGGAEVNFEKDTGETSSNYSLSIRDVNSLNQKQIEVNQYGIIETN
jgi:hypothetical protein